MTICQVTTLFHRNKDLYLFFSPRLSLILSCFYALRLSFFWYVFKMLLAVCCLAMPHFMVDEIINLLSLNSEHTGKPIGGQVSAKR